MSEAPDNFSHDDRRKAEKIVKAIIKDKLNGKGSIANIAERVKEPLLKEKVLPPEDSIRNLDYIISSVLISLKREGYVKQISEEYNIWEIYPSPLRILGEGKGNVYVFYDDQLKQAVEQKGWAIWLCNIGSTKRSVEKRIREQTSQWLVEATIGLVLKTDYPRELETKIHEILKVFDRQQKENKGKKLKGNEWFDTSPDEVIDIVAFIGKFIPNLSQEEF